MSNRYSPVAHERSRDLRHGPDGDQARDLHAVPAALRDSPRAVAAAVPARRGAVDARLCGAADRPRPAQGDQSPPPARWANPPARAPTARRELRTKAGGSERPSRRAQGHRARQIGGPPARPGDRLLPALRRRDRRAARVRRGDRHRFGHRPRRPGPCKDCR